MKANKQKNMPKITHTANEGQSQDLNSGGPSPNAIFLPLSLQHLMCLLYVDLISKLMFQKEMLQQIILISPEFLQ